jgi:hypothetical protein
MQLNEQKPTATARPVDAQFSTVPARLLLPWLDQGEAVPLVNGGRMPNPGEDVSHIVAEWQRQKNNLAGRPEYDLAVPTIEPLPDALGQRAGALMARPDMQAAFRQFNWQLAVVDLQRVLAFQPSVLHGESRVANARADDWQGLFSICLPEPQAENLVGNFDQRGNAFTFTSVNPNLRLAGQGTADVNPAQPVKLFGFAISYGLPFVQVAEYQGRWFLRDGYHRCYGLLTKGITRIPCVFIRARNFDDLGAAAPGFLKYDALVGSRPPFLTDYLSDDFSIAVQRPVVHKIIRIRAEEFVVQA